MFYSNELLECIAEVKKNKYSFCKFISRNDAGSTGAHQAGVYIPKNSIKLLFDEPGIEGENKDKYASISWPDGSIYECRCIYYGQGTRNEYRITRLGKKVDVGDLIVIIKENDSKFLGYLFKDTNEKSLFLKEFGMSQSDTNSLISYINKDKVDLIEDESNSTNIVLLNETNIINFKPKAHILVLLGEELIKNPVMAIYELIKNSYDADAKIVNVSFSDVEDLENTKIIIKDDGLGITSEVLENVWFEPGSDFRKPINNNGDRVITKSLIYNRTPMGEKGVGRFAVHKLGNKIKLISRPAKVNINNGLIEVDLLNYEIIVNIDWTIFSQNKYLEDVSISWVKNYNINDFYFSNNHGTVIEVDSLKEEWTRGMARQLKRQTISMVSPKNNSEHFKIELDFNNWWLNDVPTAESILKLAPYRLFAKVDKDYNLQFEYEFLLSNNPQLGGRKISRESNDDISRKKSEYNIKGFLKPFFEDDLVSREFDETLIKDVLNEFEPSELPYGSLTLELYSFDLDSNSLKDITSSPKFVKDLLRDHYGIKVFKGELRVYDYGDPGDDWLNLDAKRVNNKEWFSNNQVIGYVYLDPDKSGSLIEKTNREGFIHNNAYENFVTVLTFILTQFMVERQIDRNKWLIFNRKNTSNNSFKKSVSDFKDLISKTVEKVDDQNKLLDEADKLENKYEQDRDNLLIPAGVGMTASFAMHEIEKLIPRMEESTNELPFNVFKIKNQVRELRDYSEGLLSVLRKGSGSNILIMSIVEQAVNNYRSRLESRDIKIEFEVEDQSLFVHGDKRLIITIIMNIIDNSIYWLNTIYREERGIYIKISKLEKGVSVLIVDNGPGFYETIEDIIMPYYTRKKNGIGIGMYLVDTIMIQYGRLNIIFDVNELLLRNVPSKFSGAAVELIFNKMQNE